MHWLLRKKKGKKDLMNRYVENVVVVDDDDHDDDELLLWNCLPTKGV